MSQVEAITPSNPGVVKVLEDHGRHGLETGDFVKLSRVQGMPELNDTEHEVKVTGPFTFEIGDCSAFASGASATQGYITQVKKPTKVSFKDFAAASADPGELMMTDFAKFDRPGVLHTGFTALAEHVASTSSAIAPGDTAAAEAVAAAAKRMDPGLSEEQLTIVRQLAVGSSACVSPMCAAIGGVIGQEVLKAVSGKVRANPTPPPPHRSPPSPPTPPPPHPQPQFMPIKGFMYFDAEECLPAFGSLPPASVSPRGSRYDSQIALFGSAANDAILNQRYFLVGAGAIGCEMLKNWCQMGLGCGEEGRVYVTDMDHIEKSNLSRQFLFR
jgi:ubiquitin-activating enzyme E1